MFDWFLHRVAHWFSQDIVHGGRLPLLCCLVAFILTFFVTRTFVRFIRHRVERGLPARWWQPRNVHIGGVHIHHVTFGVVLVMISGLTLVTLSDNGQEPENTVSAIIFGIGAALVLDEYALILHLSDVYWEEDGRSSVDAVFAAVAVAGLLIMGLHPLMFLFPVARDTESSAWHVAVVGALVMTLPLAMVVLLKGKVWTGLLGMFIVVLLVIGAIRLSRPHAPWARWRYTTTPDKMRRALQRERKWRRPVVQAKLWLQCAIAGTPRVPDDRLVDAQLDHDVHPAAPPEGTEPILLAR
ncbi:integral membrane protein [Mycobacterium triplex]|uniref:Integral membrane protein n=1 Tax=Mycobacterium triplex TaxID=47839 RepID=A0A024K0G0_9MYCO|nr:integral membrane protein [Mycobacterium triplex]